MAAAVGACSDGAEPLDPAHFFTAAAPGGQSGLDELWQLLGALGEEEPRALGAARHFDALAAALAGAGAAAAALAARPAVSARLRALSAAMAEGLAPLRALAGRRAKAPWGLQKLLLARRGHAAALAAKALLQEHAAEAAALAEAIAAYAAAAAAAPAALPRPPAEPGRGAPRGAAASPRSASCDAQGSLAGVRAPAPGTPEPSAQPPSSTQQPQPAQERPQPQAQQQPQPQPQPPPLPPEEPPRQQPPQRAPLARASSAGAAATMQRALSAGAAPPGAPGLQRAASGVGGGGAMLLQHPALGLVGRAAEVDAIAAGLIDAGRVLVWGGPGEGKSTLLAAAGIRLYESRALSSALQIDLAGASGDIRAAAAGALVPQLQRVPRSGIGTSAPVSWETLEDWLRRGAGAGAAATASGAVASAGPAAGAAGVAAVRVQATRAPPALIILDNAELLLRNYGSEAAAQAAFSSLLDGLLGACPVLRLGVASRTSLFQPPGAVVLELGPLPERDAAALLRKACPSRLPADADVARLVRVCGCNALELRLVGGVLESGRLAPQAVIDAGSAAKAMLGRRVGNVFASPTQHLAAWWRALLVPIFGEALVRAAACAHVFSGSFDAHGASAAAGRPVTDGDLEELCCVSVLSPADGRGGGGVGADDPRASFDCEGGAGAWVCDGMPPRFTMHHLHREAAAEVLRQLDPPAADAARRAAVAHTLALGARLAALTQQLQSAAAPGPAGGCGGGGGGGGPFADAAAAARVAAAGSGGSFGGGGGSGGDGGGGFDPDSGVLQESLALPVLEGQNILALPRLIREDSGRGGGAAGSGSFGRGRTNSGGSGGGAAEAQGPALDAETMAQLMLLGKELDQRGHYTAAESLFRLALAAARAARAAAGPGAAAADAAAAAAAATEAASELGATLRSQGRLAEGEALLREALGDARAARGAGPWRGGAEVEAAAMNNLAVLLVYRGAFQEAEALHRQALEIRERAPAGAPGREANLARSLSNLGVLLGRQCRLAEAEALHRRALALAEAAHGPCHPLTAASLNNLALVVCQRGGNAAARIAEARALHERALRVRGAALGPHHPATASSLNNLANLVARSGDAAEAERLLRRALAAREAALGPAHADTSATLHNLARQLERRGEIDEAEELYARALRIREDALGDHPFTASSLSVLGRLLAKRGRGGDALPLLRRALAIREAVLRPGHPDALGSMRDLGKCLQGLGQSEEAEALLRASRPPPPPYWGVSGGRGSGGGFGGSGGGARGWGQGAPADGPWVRGSQFQLSVRPAAQAQHRQPQAQAPAMPQEQLSQQQEPKQREQPHAPEPPQQEQRQQQQQQPAAEQQSWPDHFPAFPGAAPAPAAALTSPFACFAACPSPQQTLSGACATPLGRLAQPQICASLAPGGGAAADSSADRTGGGSGGDISNGGGGGGGQVALNQAIISDLGVLEFDAAAIRRATQPPRRPLAEGSFAHVWALELGGRRYAAKVLKAAAQEGEFAHELRTLAKLSHPGIVRLEGYCAQERCLVFAFMEGGTLLDALTALPGGPSWLGWRARLRCCLDAAGGLAYLHGLCPPLLHRDIKPNNILLTGDARAKLGDVGLSRFLPQDAESLQQTLTRGCYWYLPPELTEGTGKFSRAADVYSFGLVICQLLTGAPGFRDYLPKAQRHALAQAAAAAGGRPRRAARGGGGGGGERSGSGGTLGGGGDERSGGGGGALGGGGRSCSDGAVGSVERSGSARCGSGDCGGASGSAESGGGAGSPRPHEASRPAAAPPAEGGAQQQAPGLSAALDAHAAWPRDVAQSLARIALDCTEHERDDRPSMAGVVARLASLWAAVEARDA